MDPNVAMAGAVVVEETTKELVKIVINRYIKPLLTKKYGMKYDLLIEEILTEYFSINYTYHNKMNTIVFRDNSVLLDDLYIPLELESLSHNKQNEKYIIDKYNKDLFQKYNRVLIVDMAGMGKSTIVKYMSVSMIKENCGIPLLIELRKIKKGNILEYIIEQFDFLDKEVPRSSIIDLIKRGEFTIFFDGFDEIVEDDRKDVVNAMEEFMKKCNNNKYVITSREEEDLLCFGEFEKFRIRNLEMEEAFKLIRKYDSLGKYNKAEELINDIKNNDNLEVLKEFLVNPLLVSLLYKTFLYKGEIPYKKTNFYRQVYEALFNDHDKTKGGAYVHEKRTKLDIDEFNSVMCVLGFKSLQMNQVSFNKNEIAAYIREALKLLPNHIKVSSNDVLYDITHAVPLFQEEGLEFKWVHKSFMEYFAAKFICFEQKDKQEYIINSMLEQDNVLRFYNTIDFIYEMDIKAFRKLILLKMLNEYIKHYDTTYSNNIFKTVPAEDIMVRKQLTFFMDDIVVSNQEGERYGMEGLGWKLGDNMPILRMYWSNKTGVRQLFRLLNLKNIDIFYKKTRTNRINERSKIFYATNKIEYFEKNAVETLNMDKKMFDAASSVFHQTMNRRTSHIIGEQLDYEKCIKLKQEIEEENKRVEMLNFEF